MSIEWLWRPVQVCLAGGELRFLRRQLPNVHRLWVRQDQALRQESNAEYRNRLRRLARERGVLR